MPRNLIYGPITIDPTLPGAPLVLEIDTPIQSTGARITIERIPISTAPGWPDGPLFALRVYERDRGQANPHLLFSCTMDGGYLPAQPVRGLPENPSAIIGLSWPPSGDKDVVRFEADVLQQFRTRVSLDFL